MYSRLKYRLLIFILFILFQDVYSQALLIGHHLRKGKYYKAIELGESYLHDTTRISYYWKERDINLLMGKTYLKLEDHVNADMYFHSALSLVQEKFEKGETLKLKDYDVIDEISLFYIYSGNLPAAKK